MLTTLIGIFMVITGSHTANLISEIPHPTFMMLLDIFMAGAAMVFGIIFAIGGIAIGGDAERELVYKDKEMSAEEVRNLCKNHKFEVADNATSFKVDRYLKPVKRNWLLSMGLAEKDKDIYVIHFSDGTYEVEVEK